MMGLDTPETCRGWRNILTISCASSWFLFTRFYRDAGQQNIQFRQMHICFFFLVYIATWPLYVGLEEWFDAWWQNSDRISARKAFIYTNIHGVGDNDNTEAEVTQKCQNQENFACNKFLILDGSVLLPQGESARSVFMP